MDKNFKYYFEKYFKNEKNIFIFLALLTLAIWSFAALADEVLEGDTKSLDEDILLLFRNSEDLNDPVGPLWLEEIGRDLTAFGGIAALTMISLAVIGYLLIKKKFRTVFLLLISVGGGLLLSLLLKEFFSRPRPDLVPQNSYVYTASFPSGHSMMSAVTFLTLAALLAHVEKQRLIKFYYIGIASILTIAVGISRIYVGVHWPTDVLAGWTAGAIWAAVIWRVADWIKLTDFKYKDVIPEEE